MYDYSMFRTGIRGFEKDEVLEYIRKQESETSAAIAELEGEVRKKDEIIADLRKRLEIKDDQRAQLEEERRRSFDEMSLEEHMEMYTAQGLSRKEAMKKVAADRGVSKRDIYKELL